ncbi:MAG: hypothetical protein CL943_02530 [Candidatus Diapherotrites archaeon]|uniref:Uncharacterized protein n=1 Tax=Candidatus Iainarchaeum sp. TaxID=3101447 RepID=A0A2D6M159_9ARCH|nr:hypothetical protein [Candidatus Diapherotrites archaeon]|tara:strand:- start:4540 stop:4767 length:228 start_codon:yes stop_codon:yes gene_type:complete
METLTHHIVKGIFFYVSVVLLLTLFLATLIEGLKVHWFGASFQGTFYYLISLTALATAMWVYTRGKKILQAAGYH